jgi:head-tail adaptor
MARRLLDKRISLRRKPDGKDGFGQSVAVPEDANDWPEIAPLWASFTPVSDGEKWRAGQVGGVSVGWFVVSARVTVLSSDVLIFEDRIWSVDGAKPFGRGFQEITATRKGAGAAL